MSRAVSPTNAPVPILKRPYVQAQDLDSDNIGRQLLVSKKQRSFEVGSSSSAFKAFSSPAYLSTASVSLLRMLAFMHLDMHITN